MCDRLSSKELCEILAAIPSTLRNCGYEGKLPKTDLRCPFRILTPYGRIYINCTPQELRFIVTACSSWSSLAEEVLDSRGDAEDEAALEKLERTRILDSRAIGEWRIATGQYHTLPDLGELLEWLYARIEAKEPSDVR